MTEIALCLSLLCPAVNVEVHENGEYVYLCYEGGVFPPITGPLDNMKEPIETASERLKKACERCGLCFGSACAESEQTK